MAEIRKSIKKVLKKLPMFRPEPPNIDNPERLRSFRNQFDRYRELDTMRTLPVEWEDRFPCFDDATNTTGFDRHYVFHPAWAARAVARIMPACHYDFSSSLHFATIVSAFVPVRFHDYRPVGFQFSGLESAHADLTKLSLASDSLESVSCMHVIEHIGLGRYGDPLDPGGDVKAIRELQRVTAKGGNLLFVVPVGRPRVQFNAHRIYKYRQILELFSGFELKEFALIPDSPKDGNVVVSAPEKMVDEQEYGCGCFWFGKPVQFT